ncbi:MAG: DUF4286 family protein [Paludibacteraceae bacterium]|nr:DUF4286 family protein [Paludibacteraceae bacterium]
MLIFNTTYLVPDKHYESWIKWLRKDCIPFMLQSEYLRHPQLAKVYAEEAQDGESYSVQFHVAGLEELEKWHLKYANEFQNMLRTKFGQEILFFATVLEIMDL